MRTQNATFDAIITYLKTTNTSLAQTSNQPGSVGESLLNTVKKLRDENKEVEDKWSAYMALRGGVIQYQALGKPDDDYGNLAGVLSKISDIYKLQLLELNQNVYAPATGGAGANFVDPHFIHFVHVNCVYNQKKLYQVAKAMQINEATSSGIGDFILTNALDLNEERDIFDFSNVM